METKGNNLSLQNANEKRLYMSVLKGTHLHNWIFFPFLYFFN